MLKLPRITSLKKINSPFPGNCQLFLSWRGQSCVLPNRAGMLAASVLWKSGAGNHSYCECRDPALSRGHCFALFTWISGLTIILPLLWSIGIRICTQHASLMLSPCSKRKVISLALESMSFIATRFIVPVLGFLQWRRPQIKMRQLLVTP